MKRIVILGNSVSGIKVIEELRAAQYDCEITLILPDGSYPIYLEMFVDVLAKKKSVEDITCPPKESFEQQNVHVIEGKRLNRINFKRKKIFMEDKEQIDYDLLLLTNFTENKYPDIKGTNKSGVFGLQKSGDCREIAKMIPLAETIAVQSDSVHGLQIALALAGNGREVVLITSDKHVLFSQIDDEAAQNINNLLQEKGVRIIPQSAIAEVLGDSDARAIRLQSGKILACEMVLFGETDEDFRIIADGAFQLGKAIQVDDAYKTKWENVYALDLSCEKDQKKINLLGYASRSLIDQQAQIVSADIMGREKNCQDHFSCLEIIKDGFSAVFLGDLEEEACRQAEYVFDVEHKLFKKVMVEDNVIVGAILINAQEESDKFTDMIRQKVNVEARRGRIFDDENGQTDVFQPSNGSDSSDSPEIPEVSKAIGDSDAMNPIISDEAKQAAPDS